ncbi:MAG TPA: ABC transporter ATP-binding protein [Rugosimonospora sp.]
MSAPTNAVLDGAALVDATGVAITVDGVGPAVHGVDLRLAAGEMVGLVGESGCGKSLTAFSLLGLLPAGVRAAGELRFAGTAYDLAAPDTLRPLRGRDVAMVSQDPLTALNPVSRIDHQLGDVMRTHLDLSRAQRRARVLELLERVGIPSPRRVARAYPFELSGGMRQRVLIAMAISCRPRLLIADEPTTALDTTVQAQIMELLGGLVRDEGLAMLLITHDLGLVAQHCSRVCVMYAGEIVEHGAVRAVLDRPRHPYARALIECLASRDTGVARLATIEGTVPPVGAAIEGCRFAARCHYADHRCSVTRPRLTATGDGGLVACLRSEEIADE